MASPHFLEVAIVSGEVVHLTSDPLMVVAYHPGKFALNGLLPVPPRQIHGAMSCGL